MDPLSITTGCIALVSAVGNATITVNGFIRTCRDARSDLMTIHGELNELRLVLELLQDDASTTTNIPEGLQAQVLAILTKCGNVVTDINELVSEHSEKRRTGGVRWAWEGKDKVAVLRQSLETHRGALMLAVETVQLCLAKEIKADTTAIREDASQIPEVVRNTEDILEEIQRLRIEISNRGVGQENPMLERYLDSLTTYAETIVSGDVEDLKDRYEFLRENRAGSPILESEDVPSAGRSSPTPTPSPARSPSPPLRPPKIRETRESERQGRNELEKKVVDYPRMEDPQPEEPDPRVLVMAYGEGGSQASYGAVSRPPVISHEEGPLKPDHGRKTAHLADNGAANAPSPALGGENLQSPASAAPPALDGKSLQGSASAVPNPSNRLLPYTVASMTRLSTHKAKNGAEEFCGFSGESGYYGLVSSDRETVRMITLKNAYVAAKIKYFGKNEKDKTAKVVKAQFVPNVGENTFLLIEWDTGYFDHWEIRAGAWWPARHRNTFLRDQFGGHAVSWAASRWNSINVLFLLSLGTIQPGSSEKRRRQLYAVDALSNAILSSWTLSSVPDTHQEVRATHGGEWVHVIDWNDRKIEVFHNPARFGTTLQTSVSLQHVRALSFLPEMDRDNWVLWGPHMTLTVISKSELVAIRWTLDKPGPPERVSLENWEGNPAALECRLSPNGLTVALWDINQTLAPQLRDTRSGKLLDRYRDLNGWNPRNIQQSPDNQHHVQIINSHVALAWSVELFTRASERWSLPYGVYPPS